MSALFGGAKPPAPVIPQPPPSQNATAVVQSADDVRLQAAMAQGRSSTILPGTTDTAAPNGQKTLLGS